jgi:hypothetical protein
MDYYSKYIKYKTKYLELSNQQIGGTKIILTLENTEINFIPFYNEGHNKIKDHDILELLNKAYKTKFTEFTPHSDISGEAKMWKILYDKKLVGFGVTTDLEQFEKYPNFEEKGGIRGVRGLYITSIAGNSEYKGVVGLLFNEIDKYAKHKDNNYDYLLLEAKKYEPDYLVKLYHGYGFTPIKELTEAGETGTLMCKDVKDGFNCVSRIK